MNRRATALLDDGRLRFFVGRDGERPVGAAVAFERLRAAPELWVTGVFSDFSRPGAEALGFVPPVRLTLRIRNRP